MNLKKGKIPYNVKFLSGYEITIKQNGHGLHQKSLL